MNNYRAWMLDNSTGDLPQPLCLASPSTATYDAAYVPNWQEFLDHAAEMDADAEAADMQDARDEADWIRGGC